MSFDEIPLRMMKLGVDRAWLAKECDYSSRTMAAILAPNASPANKTDKALRRIWEVLDREEERQKRPHAQEEHCQIVVRPLIMDYERWNKISMRDGLTIEEWAIASLNEAARAKTMMERQQITLLASEDLPNYKANQKPHLHAAAGSPIFSEVQEWDGADDAVLVKINGLSMSPMFADGEVISMKHKRASRTPHVAKGKIYLFAYDGGYTVKKYNTRAATQDEIEAGISYVSAKDKKPKVRVLESLNPEFPEIVLKDEAEWVAWLPAKGK